jgi:hypothetical protein
MLWQVTASFNSLVIYSSFNTMTEKISKEEQAWIDSAAEYNRIMNTNPIELVCTQHKTTREEVRKLRNENHYTFRMIASRTSDKECELPTCGEALCRDAGADV